MKSITDEEVVFDVGSLYVHLQGLKDKRKPRGIRYPLVAVLVGKCCEAHLERRFLFMKTSEIQEQVVDGLTSLSREEITPGKLLALIYSYWGIENGLHYCRDVTVQKDRTRDGSWLVSTIL